MASEEYSPSNAEMLETTSATIVAMNPDDPSPTTGEGSSDHEYSKYDDPNYYDPKWGQKAPKVWEPYLQEFAVFRELPIEIRQAIWKLTLKPRTVEVWHNTTRGYWSNVKIPTALRVNKDSRNAVGFLYPLCFGSVLHEPRIVFNFSMDTLYFEAGMWTEIPKFLTSLKDTELTQIQSIAVDHDIDNMRQLDDVGFNEYDNMDCFKKSALAMPALKEFHIVYKIDEMYHGHGFPEGTGATELLELFPYDVQQYLFHEEIHMDDEDGQSECQELPNFEHMLEGINVAKKGSLWGWKPTKLPLRPYPSYSF